MHSREAVQAFRSALSVHAKQVRRGKGRKSVIYIVLPRDAEDNVRRFFPMPDDSELFACPVGILNIGGPIIAAGAEAVSDNLRVMDISNRFHGIGVVCVDNNGAGSLEGEFVKRTDGIFHCPKIVQMVIVNVQNDGNGRMQLKKRINVFTRFADNSL